MFENQPLPQASSFLAHIIAHSDLWIGRVGKKSSTPMASPSIRCAASADVSQLLGFPKIIGVPLDHRLPNWKCIAWDDSKVPHFMTPPMCQETEETIAFPKSLLTRTTDCYALQTGRHRELIQRARWRENIHDHFGVFQNDQSGPVFLQGCLFFPLSLLSLSLYIYSDYNIYIYVCVCVTLWP